MNPTVRSEWIGNHVLEGLRADHQGGPINVTGSFGDPVHGNGASFVVVASWEPSFTSGCAHMGNGPEGAISTVTCRGANRLLTFRRNTIESNGAFQIGA